MRADIRTLTSAPASILTQPIPPSLSITTVEVMERLGGIGWVRMVAGALVSVLISALT